MEEESSDEYEEDDDDEEEEGMSKAPPAIGKPVMSVGECKIPACANRVPSGCQIFREGF
jgi:hypothetical protein